MKITNSRAALTAAAISLITPFTVGIPAHAAAPDWRWPVAGPVITPYRNGDDPYAGGQHRGIDIAAAAGTPVLAATGGRVTYAGVAGSSGLTVAVRTSDGVLDTSYLHLSSVAVRAGSRVATGDRLGAVGTSGRRSAAVPHLHFGVRDAHDRFGYRDPLDFLPGPVPPGPEAPRRVPVPIVGPAAPDPFASPRVDAAAYSGARAGVVDPSASLTGRSPAGGRAGAGAAAPALGLIGFAPLTPASSASRFPAPRGGRSSDAHPRLRTRHGAIVAGRPVRSASAGSVEHSQPVHAASRVPRPMAGPHGPTIQPAATVGTRRAPAQARRRADRGLDTGWLAACAGLVVAAVVLGKPRGPGVAGRQCWTLLLGPVRPARR